jgi:uncharacterized protein YgiM (DUF1202 family)
MSQDAGAGEKRLQNVYGQMVYQIPADQGSESESSGKQGGSFLSPVLVVVLAIAAAFLYFKGNGAGIGQFNFSSAILGQPNSASESVYQLQPNSLTRATVASDSLYLREGPGTSYRATYLLPQYWNVSLLGDYQANDRGEIWVRVLVDTLEGQQEGWVSRRHLMF